MKLSVLLSGAILPSIALAYPSKILQGDLSEEALAEISNLAGLIKKEAHIKRQLGLNVLKPGFNAKAQLISTSGEHKFIAPGPNDIRGPCPGLNSMANHGYLPRDGVASVVQLTLASNKVFGMGLDLSAFLSVYGSVMSGNITSVSIGGKPPQGGLISGVNSLLGDSLIGEPQGLSASHNRFEADASPTRADLYKTGNPVTLDISIFEQLYSMPQGPKGYDLTVIYPFRGLRHNDSVATNGHYFAGPLTHFAINAATFLFTYRYFANHTAEHPDGFLDGETLKTFESVKGELGSFEKVVGHERIPENWYRRAIGDEYGIPAFALDATDMLLHMPYLAVLGGNTGEPNTFTGVNLGDLTGGLINTENLLKGNNLACLAFQAINNAAPDILKGLLGNVLQAVHKLTDALTPVLESLSCPELAEYDPSFFQQFPGAGSGL